MSIVTFLITGIAAGLGFGAWLSVKVIGDMASEEVRGWMDLLPRTILRLAGAQLNREQRQRMYFDDWLPELQFIVQEAEGRPITRAFRALKFALGLLIAARAIARFRSDTPPPAIAGNTSSSGRSAEAAEWDDLRHLLVSRPLEDAATVAKAEAATGIGSAPQPTVVTGDEHDEEIS